ncbi:MAG: tRNA (N(6)-L-threonylcarbamoyladenosine(37)-C(2))-methylthiotransferase MtaB [Candidatus Latescibacterota bacterium]|nr:MAG: tRNA (N(6)-L-threonylcarbamoyladenosine(37)-C(2))-methylthiotransferase MtaB [Candidatus Latescibacterota bacterium]
MTDFDTRIPRAALHTLGCRLNQSETAALAAAFTRRGYRIVPFGTAADVVVINSCSVTAQSESECRRLIRGVVRRFPQSFVAVTGCYAQLGSDTLQRIPGVDLVVGNQDKPRLVELLDREGTRKKHDAARVLLRRPGGEVFTHADVGLYVAQTRANLKIQDGCDVGCSFCVIPRTRGRARSRAFHDALEEARAFIARGHREIVVTGVNLGSYRDGPRGFADLLRALDALPGLERLRISSIEPSTLTEEVLRIVADSPRLCRHLHVPVQSGNDRVLAAMHRPYRALDAERLFERASRLVPDLALGTDVMVGFPGEDDAAFRATRELVTRHDLAYLHVFSWSPRPGTRANRLADPVPRAVVRERSQRLHEVDLRLRCRFGTRFLGHEFQVLFEERKPDGIWVGLTDNYVRVGVDAPSGIDLGNRIATVELLQQDGSRWKGRLVPSACYDARAEGA